VGITSRFATSCTVDPRNEPSAIEWCSFAAARQNNFLRLLKTLSRAQPAQFDARQAARRFVRGDELASAAPLMRIKGDFPLGGYYFE